MCTIRYMIDVTRSTTLPAEALWRVLSDLPQWPSWLPTVDALRAVDPDRPAEVGASYVLNQPGLPRATWTITHWQPGASFTWESRAVGILSIGRHELTPTGEGTLVRLSIEWTGPLAGLVRLVLRRKTERYVKREADALEQETADRTNRA